MVIERLKGNRKMCRKSPKGLASQNNVTTANINVCKYTIFPVIDHPMLYLLKDGPSLVSFKPRGFMIRDEDIDTFIVKAVTGSGSSYR